MIHIKRLLRGWSIFVAVGVVVYLLISAPYWVVGVLLFAVASFFAYVAGAVWEGG